MNKKFKYLPAVAVAFGLGLLLHGRSYGAGYEDMPKADHWSYKSLNDCLSKGYLKGVDDIHIAPTAKLTRAQMAAIMNRVKDTKEKSDISKFTDMKAGDWFYDEIAKAVKAGFIKGRGESVMAANANITREEAFTILARVLEAKEAPDKLQAFKDAKEVSPWAAKAINILIEEKIVEGDAKGLRPKDGISREEFAQIIYKAFSVKGQSEAKDGVFYGDANVDQQQYPLIKPFIHPPFYNVRVKVVVDKEGKIVSVEDDGTVEKGLAPGATKEIFEKKNGAYFKQLSEQKMYDKVKGLDRSGIAALKMASGEADVLSGATETGKAFKQAILNAYDKKEGKKFLTEKQSLVSLKPEVNQNGVKVHFTNNLPKDFAVSFVSVNHGIYNGENIVEPSKVEWKKSGDGFDLIIKDKNLLAGKYMVNIVDENGKYRSPDFETGRASSRKYAFFVVDKGEKLHFDTKLTVSDNNLDNFQKNIEEITVQEWDNDKNIAVKDAKAMEIEPVGHHGTKGDYQKNPMFKKDGSINESVTFGKKKQGVFEKGKTYRIKVESFGYGDVEFMYTSKEGMAILEGKDGIYRGKASVGSFGYDFNVALEVKGGKVTLIKDADTKPTSDMSKKCHALFMEKKALDVYVGKSKTEIMGKEADIVSGATATSKAAREAILDALK